MTAWIWAIDECHVFLAKMTRAQLHVCANTARIKVSIEGALITRILACSLHNNVLLLDDPSVELEGE